MKAMVVSAQNHWFFVGYSMVISSHQLAPTVDVLVGFEGCTDVDGYIRFRNHLHFGDSAVDDVWGKSTSLTMQSAIAPLYSFVLSIFCSIKKRLSSTFRTCLACRTTNDDSDGELTACDFGDGVTNDGVKTMLGGLRRRFESDGSHGGYGEVK